VPLWRNKDIVAFHGTDSRSIGVQSSNSGSTIIFAPSLARCGLYTDFGQGFYLTTSLHQARQWANKRATTVNSAVKPPSPPTVATVLQFQLNRDWLARLDGLSFVRDTNDFWDLVEDCRGRFPPHQRTGSASEYDVVYGPVSLWLQKLIIHDCDQISFHTPNTVNALPYPLVLAMASDTGLSRTLF
jgi:hypothetical protein